MKRFYFLSACALFFACQTSAFAQIPGLKVPTGGVKLDPSKLDPSKLDPSKLDPSKLNPIPNGGSIGGKIGGGIGKIGNAADETRRRAEAEARAKAAQAEALRRKAEAEARQKAALVEAEARKQAARVDELRRQAERVVHDFNRMKDEANKNRAELQAMAKQAERGDYTEVRKRILAAGGLKSNRVDIIKGVNQGFGVVVWGKEFDQIEQQKLLAALASSVATSNPGPALAYLQYFAAATKAEVLKNLNNAPAQAQKKAQAEFEMLLVRGLNAAMTGQRPSGLRVESVQLTVAVATYNQWIDVKVNNPRLVPTEKILGVQMYRITTEPLAFKVPLPNTFQPYVKVVVPGTK